MTEARARLSAIIVCAQRYALQHHLTVVTRNEQDFQGLGVDIVNPWMESAPP